jgi:hypothetical protein
MMGARTLRWLAVVISVLAGSQLGHGLVYSARYGLDAGRYESVGVHAYFPMLATTLGAVVGLGLMVGVLLVAAARSLWLTPPGSRMRGTVRFLDVLAVAFVAQLAVFICQETIEALAAGGPVPTVGDQILWGALGQLPAAVIAAAAIVWLLTRVEEAWTALIDASPPLVFQPRDAALAAAAQPEPDGRLRLSSVFASAFRKRGPPRRPVVV